MWLVEHKAYDQLLVWPSSHLRSVNREEEKRDVVEVQLDLKSLLLLYKVGTINIYDFSIFRLLSVPYIERQTKTLND